MSNETRSGRDADPEREDALGRLIARAGRRAEPPELLEAHVRAAVHAEWQRVTDARRKRNYMIAAAAAVAAFAAVGLGTLALKPEPVAATAVGQIVRASGEVQVTTPDARATRIGAAPFEEIVRVGDVLSTGASSGINLALQHDVSVRLAPATRLEWLEPLRVRLLAGAIYVDSPRANAAAKFVIDTDYGEITHVGTQYLVSLGTGEMTVRVREGVVLLDASGAREVAQASEEIRVDTTGQVRRTPIYAYGPTWDWVEALAADFDVANKSVFEFLTWVSRETGRPVDFADPALRLEAQSAVLKGSARGLTIPQALDAVMATTNLRAQASNGRLLVTRR